MCAAGAKPLVHLGYCRWAKQAGVISESRPVPEFLHFFRALTGFFTDLGRAGHFGTNVATPGRKGLLLREGPREAGHGNSL